jgi:hypothetical protein
MAHLLSLCRLSRPLCQLGFREETLAEALERADQRVDLEH